MSDVKDCVINDVAVCLLDMREYYTPMVFLRPNGAVVNMAWHLQCFLGHILGMERVNTLHVVLTEEDIERAKEYSGYLERSYEDSEVEFDLIATVCFDFVRRLTELNMESVKKGLSRIVFSRGYEEPLFGFDEDTKSFYHIDSTSKTMKF